MGVAMLRRSLSVVAVATMLLVGASQSLAALLPPGGAVVPTPTAPPGGAVLADTGPVGFLAVDGISFAGTLRTRVLRDPANPFGGAASMTFVYDLTNIGPDTLERLVTIDFTGYLTDANFFGPGSVPSSVDRSASGKVVGWDYTGPGGIFPGGFSADLVLYTNATDFRPVVNSVINGSVAVVSSYGPAIVPEPMSIGAMGLAGLALVSRRRKA